MEGTKKIKSTSFHQYSWNSEVETNWISLIGWHHKTSSIYLLARIFAKYLVREIEIWMLPQKVFYPIVVLNAWCFSIINHNRVSCSLFNKVCYWNFCAKLDHFFESWSIVFFCSIKQNPKIALNFQDVGLFGD